MKDVNKKKTIDVKSIKNASHTYPHLAHSNMQCVGGGIICLLIVLFFLSRNCGDVRMFRFKHILHTHSYKYFRKREESVSDDRFSRKRLQGEL